MAIIKNGLGQGFSGAIGNIVFSQHAGRATTVCAKPQKSNKPPTEKQLSTRQDTSVCANFMKPLKDFLKTGFGTEAIIKSMSPYNSMISYLRANAITGLYPQRKIDFSKVLVTKGRMPVPEDIKMRVTDTGLVFNWNKQTKTDGLHFSDQVIMLAYFPVLKMTRYIAAGAQRYVGKDVLILTGIKRGYSAEVYISFVADNREDISDSVYLGQINW